MEIIHIAHELFNSCYQNGKTYRQTICVLLNLGSNKNIQLSLFDQEISIEKREHLSLTLDDLNKKFGKGTIHIADSLQARLKESQSFKIPKLEINV